MSSHQQQALDDVSASLFETLKQELSDEAAANNQDSAPTATTATGNNNHESQSRSRLRRGRNGDGDALDEIKSKSNTAATKKPQNQQQQQQQSDDSTAAASTPNQQQHTAVASNPAPVGQQQNSNSNAAAAAQQQPAKANNNTTPLEQTKGAKATAKDESIDKKTRALRHKLTLSFPHLVDFYIRTAKSGRKEKPRHSSEAC